MLASVIFAIYFISSFTSTNNLSKQGYLQIIFILFLFWTEFIKVNLHLIPNWFRSNHLQISYKVGVLKNFPKFVGKHICWSHFLIKLQVWRRETSLKRDSNRDIFLEISHNFSKNLIYRTPLDDLLLLIHLTHPRFYPLITLFSFIFLLLLLIIAIMGVFSKRVLIKWRFFKKFFTIIYPKININVVKAISTKALVLRQITII